MSRVWNSLRKAAGKDGQQNSVGAATQILRKLTGVEQFEQSEFKAFVAGLKSAGIVLLPIDAFAARYETYFEGGRRARREAKPDANFGLLKFDIHGDIARPVEMARILNGLGVPGLFLAMHKHALNDSWYGNPQMW